MVATTWMPSSLAIGLHTLGPAPSVAAMLRLSATAHAALVGHAYDGLPDEACGLLVGTFGAPGEGGLPAEAHAPRFEPCRNAAESARVYEVDPRDHLRIDRAAEAAGREIVGVVHSHTHTDAYPSPTDVARAPDPAWHYVIVSLRQEAPVVRSYRIIDEGIIEEPVVVVNG
jgi:proteasome lid subunit RPN8/RPN11